MRILFAAASAAMLVAACQTSPATENGAESVALETTADSVAHRIYEFHGGHQAWASVPFIRFDFGFEGGGESRVAARHLWDRSSGDYRVEWPATEGGTYVALFNVAEPDAARLYLDGEEVGDDRFGELRGRAYQRFINDTYWLLSATKLFDDGVSRHHEPDSSDARFDVIRIEFEGVGLTPGDRYWYWADRESGRVERWAYVLQGNPDAAPTYFDWENYRTFDSPGGAVQLSARKAASGADRAIVFGDLDLPAVVNRDVFFDPSVIL